VSEIIIVFIYLSNLELDESEGQKLTSSNQAQSLESIKMSKPYISKHAYQLLVRE